MGKRFISALVCALTLTALLCGVAGAVETEQIQVSMPRVDVYLHTDGEALDTLPLEQISATMNGAAMEVESFQPSDQGIFYIFMLDISRSIPAEHLAAAKEAVHHACDGLRPQDKVALLSFGNSVNVLCDGSEPVETVLTKLDALSCTDDNTQFYTAMDTLVEMAAKGTDLRRIAVVFSDGIDDTDAGMSQAELENVLLQSGIAVYAMCIDTAQPQAVDSFRSFIRLSGGELYTFGASDGSAVLEELLGRLNNVWLLQLLSTSETEGGQVSLHIQFGSLAEVNATLESAYWTADITAPYVTGVTLDAAAKTVTVTFSEPILNGEELSGYVLTDSAGTAVNIASAAYARSDRRSVRLTVPEVGAAGTYTIQISGQKDLSKNHNLLTAYQGTLSGGGAPEGDNPAPESAVQTATKEALARELRKLILLTVGAIAAVAGLIVLIVLMHRRSDAAGAGKRSGGKKQVKNSAGRTPRG